MHYNRATITRGEQGDALFRCYGPVALSKGGVRTLRALSNIHTVQAKAAAAATKTKPVSNEKNQSIMALLGEALTLGTYPILAKSMASGIGCHCPFLSQEANCSVRTGMAMHDESTNATLLNVQIRPSSNKITNLLAPAAISPPACRG